MPNTTYCVDDLRHYSVVSPEVGSVVPILDDGTGPMEYWRGWCLVLARNKSMAKVEAVKSPDFQDYVQEARSDNVCPFTGLEVELATCEHDVCWGCVTVGGDYCEDCRVDDEEWGEMKNGY